MPWAAAAAASIGGLAPSAVKRALRNVVLLRDGAELLAVGSETFQSMLDRLLAILAGRPSRPCLRPCRSAAEGVSPSATPLRASSLQGAAQGRAAIARGAGHARHAGHDRAGLADRWSGRRVGAVGHRSEPPFAWPQRVCTRPDGGIAPLPGDCRLGLPCVGSHVPSTLRVLVLIACTTVAETAAHGSLLLPIEAVSSPLTRWTPLPEPSVTSQM